MSITMICLLIGYIGWILLPSDKTIEDDTIEVRDYVGLSKSQQDGLVDYARSIGSFSGSIVSEFKRDSLLKPWSKSEFKLFISISGTHTVVEVTAGFSRGLAYGSGMMFTAKWIDGGWKFSRECLWAS